MKHFILSKEIEKGSIEVSCSFNKGDYYNHNDYNGLIVLKVTKRAYDACINRWLYHTKTIKTIK